MKSLKSEMRKHFKQLRAGVDKQELSLRTLAIVSRTEGLLPSLLQKIPSPRIAGYSPIGNELDCLKVLQSIDENFKKKNPNVLPQYFLPWVTDFKKSQMSFFMFKPDMEVSRQNLREGKFGLEPKDPLTVIIPSRLDLVFTPLVAFDANLNRLGYGKGFYDRFFNSHKIPLKIGLAFEFQRIEESTVNVFESDSTNVPLDYIITDERVYVRDQKIPCESL